MFDLTGKIALVTGAGQNVGAGIARALVAAGAKVAVNDYVGERAEEVAATLGTEHAVAVPFDVTDFEAYEHAVAEVRRRLGVVDILVSNAGNGGVGGMRPAPFRELEPEEWRHAIDVNLYGVLNGVKCVIDDMCAQRSGRVITISSGAGVVGLRIGVSPYAAGKGGAISFMRHLAMEVARSGVTANTLALGLMQSGAKSDLTADLARQIPVGRLGSPDDVGAACVYLASNEASWMTGQTINLNGGNVTT